LKIKKELFAKNWLTTEVHWLQCVEKMKNVSQVQQHIEESQWPSNAIGLWTHITNNKK
jgi:hypothetical protein